MPLILFRPNWAMQMVNESALCVNRIRVRGSLCNQGFSLVNGLSFLASDECIHHILDKHSMTEYEQMQETLLQLRMLNGHYRDSKTVLALDHLKGRRSNPPDSNLR